MPGVTFSYKGTEIANSGLIAPGTRTLKPQGKYCEGNFSITYTNPDIEITPQKDGVTRLYLTIPNQCDLSKLTIPLYWNQDISEGVIVDWGDGGNDSPFTVSGTGNVSAPTPHVYPAGGNYIITMRRPEGVDTTIMLGNNSSSTGLLGDTGTNNNIYRGVLTGIETGAGVTTIRQYCFQRFAELRTVILGSDITAINNYAFNYDYGIGSIHFLGTLPANGSIGATNTWNLIPIWCKVYVPSTYFDANNQVQNIPSRMPSTSTYTYAVEPYAYTS